MGRLVAQDISQKAQCFSPVTGMHTTSPLIWDVTPLGAPTGECAMGAALFHERRTGSPMLFGSGCEAERGTHFGTACLL